jgi:hypothetical protein
MKRIGFQAGILADEVETEYRRALGLYFKISTKELYRSRLLKLLGQHCENTSYKKNRTILSRKLTALPAGRKIIHSKWFHKTEKDELGEI